MAGGTTEITDVGQLSDWLGANGWFEDAFVLALDPPPQADGAGTPDRVTLELGQQIAGGLRAGETRTLRVIRVEAVGVRKWSQDDPAPLEPGYCLPDGIDLHEPEGSLGLVLDLPGRPALVCSRLSVVPLPDLTERVEPCASDRMFWAIAPGRPRPMPAEWVVWVRDAGLEAVWRRYGEEPEPTALVPEDYTGWLLQEPGRIAVSPTGLFFFQCGPDREGNLAIQIEAIDEVCSGLWAACGRVVGSMPGVEVHCGNCRLTGEQWLEYLGGGGREYLDRLFIGTREPTARG
jgi:hypothetical protein